MPFPNSVLRSVIDLGGLAATFELYRRGHTRAELAAAVRSRHVIRARQGWYARSDLHPTLIRAARVGGRLTCSSALAIQGVWTPPVAELHVAVPQNSCRLRLPLDSRSRLADAEHPAVRVHWYGDADGTRLLLTPFASVSDLLHCHKPDMVTAVAGSLLRERPELRAGWAEFIATTTVAQREWLGRVDSLCESGTESLLWFRMRRYFLPLRRQVYIPGAGRVDFLVGRRLVVEVDGAAHHTDPVQFEEDRRRDAALSRTGYRVLRFSYRQVMDHWNDVENAILAAVLRGDHL